jgi:hypothetical protein
MRPIIHRLLKPCPKQNEGIPTPNRPFLPIAGPPVEVKQLAYPGFQGGSIHFSIYLIFPILTPLVKLLRMQILLLELKPPPSP